MTALDWLPRWPIFTVTRSLSSCITLYLSPTLVHLSRAQRPADAPHPHTYTLYANIGKFPTWSCAYAYLFASAAVLPGVVSQLRCARPPRTSSGGFITSQIPDVTRYLTPSLRSAHLCCTCLALEGIIPPWLNMVVVSHLDDSFRSLTVMPLWNLLLSMNLLRKSLCCIFCRLPYLTVFTTQDP